MQKTHVSGKENIPEGSFIIAANHPSNDGGATINALLQAFAERPFRPAMAKRLLLKRGITTLPQQLIGKYVMDAIPVSESLAHVRDEDELENILKRVPFPTEPPHYRNIYRNPPSGGENKAAFRDMRKTLQEGKPLLIFPEGLWTYEEKKGELRRAYNGLGLIARITRRSQKGQDVPVLPVVVKEVEKGTQDVSILPPVTVTEYEATIPKESRAQFTFADWVMTKIAAELPQKQRGHYGQLVEQHASRTAE